MTSSISRLFISTHNIHIDIYTTGKLFKICMAWFTESNFSVKNTIWKKFQWCPFHLKPSVIVGICLVSIKIWNKVTNQEGIFLIKFNQGKVVRPNKSYFIRLRGRKQGQGCASVGHLEVFSMSSGERQRKSRGTLKKQEMYKWYSRGRAEAHERNNRGTKDVQQRYKRWTTEVQQRPYTELRIHNTHWPTSNFCLWSQRLLWQSK